MKYNPTRHNRHFIRLHGYDYATTGAYFVTICLNQRIPNIQDVMETRNKDAINRAPTINAQQRLRPPQNGAPVGAGFACPTTIFAFGCAIGRMADTLSNP